MLRSSLLRRGAPRIIPTIRITPVGKLPLRPVPSSSRTISFLPWRRKQAVDPTLPVFFPSDRPHRRRRVMRSIGRFFFATLVFYVCANVYVYFVFDPLLDWADSEWESMTEKEKQELESLEEEEDEPLLFLPAPFTIRKYTPPMYHPTSPEYKEFLAINRDVKRQNEIKRSLANVIRRRIELEPKISEIFGMKPTMNIKRMWLDIYYPATPPPLHYVAGLMVDEDAISWGERLIDSHVAHQLNGMLYPKAMALTTWTFIQVLSKSTINSIGEKIGLSSNTPVTAGVALPPQDMAAAIRRLGGVDTSSPKPTPRTQDNGQEVQNILFKYLGESSLRQAPPGPIRNAMVAAMATFKKNYKPAEQPLPSGSVRVEGIMELHGKPLTMTISVQAWYDPKQKKFLNTKVTIKNMLRTVPRPQAGKIPPSPAAQEGK